MNALIDGISTSLSDTEAIVLEDLANFRRVLECGTFQGYSAITMASRAQQVTTIDHHRTWGSDTVLVARRNVARYHVNKKVLIIVGEFDDVLPQLTSAAYDFGFLDGFDSADDVVRFVDLMSDCLTDEALLAIHDYNSVPVRSGVERLADWRVQQVVGTLVVLERVS